MVIPCRLSGSTELATSLGYTYFTIDDGTQAVDLQDWGEVVNKVELINWTVKLLMFKITILPKKLLLI